MTMTTKQEPQSIGDYARLRPRSFSRHGSLGRGRRIGGRLHALLSMNRGGGLRIRGGFDPGQGGQIDVELAKIAFVAPAA